MYFADKKNTSKPIWNEINFKDALIIGFFQILAFIPGASRAGVTITGARFLGFDRKNAAIFLNAFINSNNSSIINIINF